MTQTPPVLLCAYSRLGEFTEILERLVALKIQRIYVNIDGSTDKEILYIQAAMMKKIEEVKKNKPDVKIYVRQSISNLGSAVSMISAMDWFFSKVEFGIILEDDLLINSDFIRFIEWAKISFQSNESVWILSGSNFFSNDLELGNKIQFPMYPITWGWATWAEKWVLMRASILSYQNRVNKKMPLRVKKFWLTGAKRCRLGLIDAWDIPLAYFMRGNCKFSVVPPRNLVSNIGFTNLATHTNLNEFPLGLKLENLSMDFESITNTEFDLNYSEKYSKALEERVYKITIKNSLSFLASKFDFLVKKQKFALGLQCRLESISNENFI
jgi:hypothetical protein